MTREKYAKVLKVVPGLGMKERMKNAFCRLCQMKPAATWNNLVGYFGAKYVDGLKLPEIRSSDFVGADTPETIGVTMGEKLKIDDATSH